MDNLQRLAVAIDLLESLAKSGLPTLISSFQRSGDFTKLHTVFHTDTSTSSFPRVGNWNFVLVGSLLCPPLRATYNNTEACGSFMEAFTVSQAKLQPRPSWYAKYQKLVALVDLMMDTCTPATYDAMKWKINPAEFIHVIRVHEGAQAALLVKPEAATYASCYKVKQLAHKTLPLWKRRLELLQRINLKHQKLMKTKCSRLEPCHCRRSKSHLMRSRWILCSPVTRTMC